MRPAVDDFYGTHYLRPTNRPRPTGVVGPAGVVHPAGTAGPAGAGTASKPRIAVVPERFDIGFPTPCGYIRLLQPLHHPAIARGFDVRVTSAETMLRQDAEIIVTQRFAMRDMREADRLAAHARAIGATLVFDLDDDLLAIPRNHPDARVLRPRAAVVRRMLDLADVVWLSTPGLAERLGSIRPDAMVMENGLDERIWTPPALPPHDQPVRILCMGTTTHDSDFALIEPALVRIKAEYRERVVIDIIGMTARSDVPAGLNRIGPPVTARRSYPGFVHWLASAEPQWHIGLAPLLDTPFNRCKSPIKAMDYAAMGLTVLASDTPVYQGSLADGPAGQLVANTPAAWYAALNWRLRDREALQAAAARSREAFLTRASLASQAEVRRGAWSRLRNVRKTDAAA
jgi:hypothetical protein